MNGKYAKGKSEMANSLSIQMSNGSFTSLMILVVEIRSTD